MSDLSASMRFEDRGWQTTRCPPRSPAGTRGDDGIGPVAVRQPVTDREGRYRPDRISVLAVVLRNYCAVEIDRALLRPLPEGDLDRRFSEALAALIAGRGRVVGIRLGR